MPKKTNGKLDLPPVHMQPVDPAACITEAPTQKYFCVIMYSAKMH